MDRRWTEDNPISFSEGEKAAMLAHSRANLHTVGSNWHKADVLAEAVAACPDSPFSDEDDADAAALTLRQVSSMCARVHDDLEELPRAARKAALLEVMQVCIMSPYFDRTCPQELDFGDHGRVRLRISRVLKRRRVSSPVHPRIRPRFPGKADQLERKLAWEARESWAGQDDPSPEGQEAAGEMFESADCSVVEPPGAAQSIWDALKPARKDRSNNPEYTTWPIRGRSPSAETLRVDAHPQAFIPPPPSLKPEDPAWTKSGSEKPLE